MTASMWRRVRWLLVVLAGVSVMPPYVWAYKLAGPSDIPTVLLGDTVIVNKAAYRVRLL